MDAGFIKPCKTFDQITTKVEVGNKELKQIINEYENCRIKMNSTIEYIQEAKKLTDEISREIESENIIEKEKALDPFSKRD